MSAYTQFNGGQPLNEDQLRGLVPSIFATTAHESRSERFRAIPTIDVLRGLRKEGFEVFSATQSVCRTPDRKPFAKHLLRMRNISHVQAVGDTFLELCLKNANDGTSIYDLFAGLFRVKCMNGMVASEASIGTVKVRHSGNVTDKVIEGTYTVMDTAQKLLEAPKAWSGIVLDQPEQLAYAESAHRLRFADADGNVDTPIQPAQLLHRRRSDDMPTDLWTTFNVVQENVLKGGLSAVGHDAQNRTIRRTTRAIKGIDQDVKLNRALWELTNKMAELKAA